MEDQFPNTGKPDFKNRLSLIDNVLAGILGIIVSVMIAQVFFRYILNNSLVWSEELVRFLFIWMTFLGAAINIRDKWHIGVEYLLTLLPKHWANWISKMNWYISLMFLVFLSLGGFYWMVLASGTRSSVLGLPINWILYGALPFTSLLGCYYIIQRLISANSNNKINGDI
jgi:TRAP-type C4-dicarboxylate transport system permease small subunit